MNKVILIGNLTKDVELKALDSGKMVAKGAIAVGRITNKEKTDFFNFEAWEKKAEVLSQYTSKGSKVMLEGRLETDSYEKDGETKKYQVLRVDNVELLGSKKDKPQDTPPSDGCDL